MRYRKSKKYICTKSLGLMVKWPARNNRLSESRAGARIHNIKVIRAVVLFGNKNIFMATTNGKIRKINVARNTGSFKDRAKLDK